MNCLQYHWKVQNSRWPGRLAGRRPGDLAVGPRPCSSLYFIEMVLAFIIYISRYDIFIYVREHDILWEFQNRQWVSPFNDLSEINDLINKANAFNRNRYICLIQYIFQIDIHDFHQTTYVFFINQLCSIIKHML